MSEQILRDVAASADLDVVLLRYFNPVGAHESGTSVKIRTGSRTISSRMSCRWRSAGWRGSVSSGRLQHPRRVRCADYIHVVDLAEGPSPRSTRSTGRWKALHGGQPRYRRGLVRSEVISALQTPSAPRSRTRSSIVARATLSRSTQIRPTPRTCSAGRPHVISPR